MKKILLLMIIFLCFIFNINTFAYSKSVIDITTMDIYEIQNAIDKGYLTYELLTKIYLERIEKYDPNFNTIITINKNALKEAKEKDIEYKKYGRSSILFGIPIIIKDNIDVSGMPTTVGTKTLSDSYPNSDSEVVANLKEQGAIVIAKANMSEFAFFASSSISSYGTVKNAYNTAYSSYGSSGGVAVAISLQFATLGIGTDTNASIRVPASANNIIGFRPTLGLLSNDGIVNYDITRDTVGIMTKYTKENALLLAVLEGKNENYYTKNIKNPNTFTIGVINDFLIGNDSGLYGTEKTLKEIVELFNKKLDTLKEQEVEIVYIDDFYSKDYSYIDNSTLGGWTMCYAFNNYIKNTNSSINNFYDLAYSRGHIYSLWNYVTDCSRNINNINNYKSEKEVYEQYINKIYEKYDLDFLAYPTTKNKLLKVTDDTSNFSSPSSLIAPVLGLPAMSLSLGEIEGLYYGIELVGLKNSEELMYQFSYFYENINPTYTLSSLTPSLYEIPEEVTKLKDLYEDNINLTLFKKLNILVVKDYNKLRTDIKEFLTNYNNYEDEDIEDYASKLYTDYDKAINNLNKNYYIIIVSILILILFILIIKREIFKHKLKKKRKYK